MSEDLRDRITELETENAQLVAFVSQLAALYYRRLIHIERRDQFRAMTAGKFDDNSARHPFAPTYGQMRQAFMLAVRAGWVPDANAVNQVVHDEPEGKLM